MQSYNDLNNYSNTPVTYGSSADYVIVFGANAGNLSVSQLENSYFLMYKQVPLETFSIVSRDLLVSISTTQPDKTRTPVYIGANPNIQIFEANAANWSITGIRSVADYDDVFANTYLGIKGSITGTVGMTFLLDDQRGTTRTYTATITATANPMFTFTSPIAFAEDTLTAFTNLAITDTGFAFATNYSMTLTSTDPVKGKIWLGNNNLVTSHTITGTKAAVNSAVASLRFAPGADYTGSAIIDVTVTRTYDDTETEQAIDANWNGTSHSDYSIPVSYSIAEDSQIGLSGLSITDLRPDNISSNTQYTIDLNSADNANISFTYGNVTSSSVTISGTKSSINTILADANARPKLNAFNNFQGQGTITYNQVNTTDSVVQAAQVPITIFVSDDPGYSLTTGYVLPIFDAGLTGNTRLIWSITEETLVNTTYNINFSQLTGNAGTFFVNNSNTASSSGSITGNRATINNNTINFVTTVANTANATLQWSATATTANVTTPMSGNVTLTLQPAITNLKSFYNYTSNTSTAIFATTNTPVLNSALAGQITLSISTGNGYVGTNDADGATTWTVSGTTAQINSILPNVRFWPTFREAGNVTANLTVTGSGTTWVSRTLALTGTAAPVPSSLTSAPVYVTSSVYTPDLSRWLYCDASTIIVIGGGGGGGVGGGGSGAVATTSAVLSRIPYAVSVGSGGRGAGSAAGAQGRSGGSSSAFGATAAGGSGGFNGVSGSGFWASTAGGSSGSGQAGGGGGFSNTRQGGGGGGGGAGSAGSSGGGSGNGGGGVLINGYWWGKGGPGWKGLYAPAQTPTGQGGGGGQGFWSGTGFGSGSSGGSGSVAIFWTAKT